VEIQPVPERRFERGSLDVVAGIVARLGGQSTQRRSACLVADAGDDGDSDGAKVVGLGRVPREPAQLGQQLLPGEFGQLDGKVSRFRFVVVVGQYRGELVGETWIAQGPVVAAAQRPRAAFACAVDQPFDDRGPDRRVGNFDAAGGEGDWIAHREVTVLRAQRDQPRAYAPHGL